IKLDDILLRKINDALSPFGIEDKLFKNHVMYINEKPASINVVKENFNKISYWSPLGSSKLINFIIDYSSKDFVLNNFIIRNYGAYNHSEGSFNISEDNLKTYKISNRDDFKKALDEIVNIPNVIYPIQLCSLPNYFKEVEKYDANPFTIVIGNTIEDYTYAWNNALFVPKHVRHRFNQVCIPQELIDDESLNPSLTKWLKKTYEEHNNQLHQIKFTSISLDDQIIEEYSNKIFKEKHIIKTMNKSIFTCPKFWQNDPFYNLENKKLEINKITKEYNEEFKLSETFFIEETKGYGNCMADLYIEYDLKSENNHQLFYKLPRKNILAGKMFRGKARITEDGVPSVVIDLNDPRVNINILKSNEIFECLFRCDYKPGWSEDSRGRLISEEKYFVKESSNGKYLNGMIGLFGGLDNTYNVFKEKYWRKVFDFIICKDVNRYDKRVETLKTRIKKRLTKHPLTNGNIEEWIERIYEYSKQIIPYGQEIPFVKGFLRLAIEELEEINKMFPEYKLTIEVESLKDEIAKLVTRNILFMGINSHCKYCSYANWYDCDNIKHVLKCNGCGNMYTIGTDQKWSYRLNTLIQDCYLEQGLLPEILVLGQIAKDARVSYMYSNSLDIFNYKTGEKITDIDIICIKDGKFIIGEVKNSMDKFSQGDFDKMKEISKAIKPNVVVFSSLDLNPNSKVQDKIRKLQEELITEGIEVKWFSLEEETFKPSDFFRKYV
ncbi:MAG: hypothetical protein KJ844_04430, partial [Candidatus Edwardsbacteria bacterium]|nr:hypothetical protein [Candidatus Edwardsbacteria bacterium]